MASKLDQIIATQVEQGKMLATYVERQANFHERIFGKDSQKGALQFLQDEIKVVDVKIETEKTDRTNADAALTKSHGEIKTKLTMWTGIATGAGMVIGWVVKVAAPKLASVFHP